MAAKVFSYFIYKDLLERKVEYFGTLQRLQEITRNVLRHAQLQTPFATPSDSSEQQ